MYVHCLYIDKWPNSKCDFNNWIVIFHHFLHRMNSHFEVLIHLPFWSDLRSVQKIWPLPGPKDIYKMSALRGNSFFGRMIEGLGRLLLNVPCWMREIPYHLNTQEMCNEIMRTMPNTFHRIPDHFKTQEMCIKGAEVDPWHLYDVPDHSKIQKMCERAVEDDPS